MKTPILAVACASIALAAYADDAAEIKRLIPSATAIARKDYDKLTKGELQGGLASFEQPSLTAALMLIRPGWEKDSREALEAFDPDGHRILNLKALLKEMSREPRGAAQAGSDDAVITFIHSDRITDFQCKVDGNAAKGVVSWELPGLFKGKFDYVARRNEGKWQITEIHAAGRGIHLVRDERGKWKQK